MVLQAMPSLNLPKTILFGKSNRVVTPIGADKLAEVIRLLASEQGIKCKYERVLIHVPMKVEVDYVILAKALIKAGLCRNDSLIAYRRVYEHPSLIRIHLNTKEIE